MTDKVFKAYSLLTEKSFEDGDAVIRGFATTPTPDRVSDVVVPDGVVFRTNDIKLHLYHDTRLPVGNVKFGAPTKKGLPFEARLPEVKEEGTVRDRVNEARHSIKYNLISAVSIGFRALEGGVEILKNGGFKFNLWEMIELSLTSVPMNPEADFAAVKSLSYGERLPPSVLQAIKQAERHDFGLRGSGPVRLIQPKTEQKSSLPGGAVKLIASS